MPLRPIPSLLAAAVVLAAAFPGGAVDGVTHRRAMAANTPADSLLNGAEAMVVRSQAAPPPAEAVTRVPAPLVEMRDAGTLADLGVLLPSVRVTANSRGESAFSVRGAPERHSQAFLDGIPLNQAWDERVDLQSVPIVGIGRLVGRRGLPSLLAGPGTLSGSVRILAPRLPMGRARTHLRLAGGPRGLWRGGLTHQRRSGPWNLLGAFGAAHRDHWPLPAGEGRRRNSDAAHSSLLLRGSRALDAGGRLNLLIVAWRSSRGVPAERHLGRDARFWRYPVRGRALLGGSLFVPGEAWDVAAMVAGDLAAQEIDPRGPHRWGTPRRPGDDYAKNWDRTGHAMAGLTRHLPGDARLTLQGNARYTRHREILTEGGPTLAYTQWLTALVLEGEKHWAAGWGLRAGLGYDQAATPEAGDKPRAASFAAEAWNLRLSRQFHPQGRAYATISRRSRFPGLRELYSGALGRFVTNPDLKPERQDLLEAGLELDPGPWRLTAAAFLQNLHDGIEKVALPGAGRPFMRVNRTRIRVSGVELSGTWRARHDLAFSAQHTILQAKLEQDGRFTRWAEDRPQYLGRLAVDYHPDLGFGLLLEAAFTGPRWSADATDPQDGLRRLPAGIVWNGRLRYSWMVGRHEVEAHLRADNLLDTWVDDQVGLPGPGRLISAGVRARL